MTGTSQRADRPGFSLIEILIVVVILGILASIGLWRSSQVTRQANLTTLKSDLRSLSLLQEVHKQMEMRYVALDSLDGFRPSAGVSVDLTWLDRDGFAATATHEGLAGVTCGVFRGPAADDVAAPARSEGVIACE